VRFGEHVIVLDPALVLKRCFGPLPLFEIEDGLKAQGRHREFEAVKQAFADYTEIYAQQAFESLTGTVGVKRVFSDRDLKRTFKGKKVADVVIDYGDAWVVVEVTTSQAARSTVNGASVDGLAQDIKTILREAEQVSATINHIRRKPEALTGSRRKVPMVFIQ